MICVDKKAVIDEFPLGDIYLGVLSKFYKEMNNFVKLKDLKGNGIIEHLLYSINGRNHICEANHYTRSIELNKLNASTNCIVIFTTLMTTQLLFSRKNVIKIDKMPYTKIFYSATYNNHNVIHNGIDMLRLPLISGDDKTLNEYLTKNELLK